MRKLESTTKTIAGCTHHQSRRMVSPKRRRTRGSWACAMSDEASAADGRERVDRRAGIASQKGYSGGPLWLSMALRGTPWLLLSLVPRSVAGSSGRQYTEEGYRRNTETEGAAPGHAANRSLRR